MNFLRASIMVVDSQTLRSSCVLNRDNSVFDLSTAKIGNRSSWQTVSQKSTGNEVPYFVSVEKSESNALQDRLERRERLFCDLLTNRGLRGLRRS